MSKLTDLLIQSTDAIASARLSSAKNDQTVKVKITKLVNANIGEYKAVYEDASISIYSIDPSIRYFIGEVVYILVPQGDFSQKKIIVGRNNYLNNVENSTKQALLNYWIDKTENFAEKYIGSYKNNIEFGITSGNEDDDIVIFERAANQQDYNSIDNIFAAYGEMYEYLKISADFRTALLNPTIKGEYYLEIKFGADDIESEEGTLKTLTYKLGFDDFNGSPFNCSSPVTQSAYFKIDKGLFKQIQKITLKQDNLVYDKDAWGQQVKNDKNIFVSNIKINFAEKVNLFDYEYFLNIASPRGNTFYFDSQSDQLDDLLLLPQFFYNQQQILPSEQALFMWFKQDLSIQVQPQNLEKDFYGKTWYDYGGKGWKYIEDSVDKTGVTEYYDPDTYMLTVKQDAFYQQQNYKLVMAYYDNDNNLIAQTFKEITLNKQSSRDYFIKQDSFYDDKGILKIRLTLYNKNTPTAATWYYQTTGSSLSLIDGTDITPISNIIASDYLINGTATFFAEYIPEKSSTGKKESVNYALTTSLDTDVILDWIGQDTFSYDAAGKAKKWTVQDEYILTPKLDWIKNTGDAVQLTFKGPNGEIIPKGVQGGTAQLIPNSMLNSLWVDSENALHFRVSETYVANKMNNTITLEIKTISKTYSITKEIIFIKDGGLGTTGGEWSAQLYPVYQQKGSVFSGFNEKRIGLCPIILKANGMTDEDNYIPFYIRPFVTKDGIDIDTLNSEENRDYHYTVEWDVRTPISRINRNATSKPDYHSVLRLYDLTKNEPVAPIYDQIIESNISYFENELVEGEEKNGLVARTTSNDFYGPSANSIKTYGAVKVKCDYFNLLPQLNFRSIIKASINIYSGMTLLSTINTFYPIDILLNRATQENIDLSESFLEVPSYIEYNSAGYSPLYSNSKLNANFKIFSKEDGAIYKTFVNNTPQVQNISIMADNSGYYYNVNSDLNSVADLWGSIVYKERKTSDDSKYFEYYRNQIIYMNVYGNNTINSWDGTGIDMNEETGSIMSALVGAGYKDSLSNTFTGVIMGQNSAMPKTESAIWNYDIDEKSEQGYLTGLFGYQNGKTTFGFMENGTGFIGGSENGARILFNGKTAVIEGGELSNNNNLYDNMFNRMRLSLLDTKNQAQSETKTVFGKRWEQILQDEIISTTETIKNSDGYLFVGGQQLKLEINGEEFLEKANIEFDSSMENVIGYKVEKDMGDYSVIIKTYYDSGTDGGYKYKTQLIEKNNNDNNTNISKTINLYLFNTYAVKHDGNLVSADYQGHYFGTPDDINKFPNWYEKVWQKAYIKKEGSLPYWLKDESYESLPEYDPNGEFVENSKINYYSNQDSANGQTFYPGQMTTSPAIEVGQHIKGLMPGILGFEDYENVFKTLKIPGDRNFMVTYDGTLWAMNGNFMGNIIGSNIIGGKIQGAEIGLGIKNLNSSEYKGLDNQYIFNTQGKIIDNFDSISLPSLTQININDEVLKGAGYDSRNKKFGIYNYETNQTGTIYFSFRGEKYKFTTTLSIKCLALCLEEIQNEKYVLRVSENINTYGTVQDYELYEETETPLTNFVELEEITTILENQPFSNNNFKLSTYFDNEGNLHAYNAHFYGSQFDIGNFHISTKGELYQSGDSLFKGTSAFYGNLLITPLLNENYTGNLFSSGGRVGLGIPLMLYGKTDQENYYNLSIHQNVINSNIINIKNKQEYSTNSIFSYIDGSTFERSCFFGIDSTLDRKHEYSNELFIQGHMYPLHFEVNQKVPEIPSSSSSLIDQPFKVVKNYTEFFQDLMRETVRCYLREDAFSAVYNLSKYRFPNKFYYIQDTKENFTCSTVNSTNDTYEIYNSNRGPHYEGVNIGYGDRNGYYFLFDFDSDNNIIINNYDTEPDYRKTTVEDIIENRDILSGLEYWGFPKTESYSRQTSDNRLRPESWGDTITDWKGNSYDNTFMDLPDRYTYYSETNNDFIIKLNNELMSVSEDMLTDTDYWLPGRAFISGDGVIIQIYLINEVSQPNNEINYISAITRLMENDNPDYEKNTGLLFGLRRISNPSYNGRLLQGKVTLMDLFLNEKKENYFRIDQWGTHCRDFYIDSTILKQGEDIEVTSETANLDNRHRHLNSNPQFRLYIDSNGKFCCKVFVEGRWYRVMTQSMSGGKYRSLQLEEEEPSETSE